MTALETLVQRCAQRLGGIKPLRDGFERPSEQQILEIKRSLGPPLPASYRWFVASFGECCFGGHLRFRAVQAMPSYLGSDVYHGWFGHFLGAEEILDNQEIFENRKPESVFFFGYESGNHFALGVRGSTLGKVYYWDHENEWSESGYVRDHGKPMPPEIKFQNLHLIANSFEEFLESLEVIDEDEE